MTDLIAQRTARDRRRAATGGGPARPPPAPAGAAAGGRRGRARIACVGVALHRPDRCSGSSVFYLWPTVRTLLLSFTESGPFGGSEFVGLANYCELFDDPELCGALLQHR